MMNIKFRKIAGYCILLMILLLTGISQADEGKSEDKREKVVGILEKEVQGEVSWVNSRYIAIAYNRDPVKGSEDEMLLPIDSTKIQLEHKQSLDEIGVGDTVRVRYVEETLENEKGDKKDSRKAAIISFVRPAVKKPADAKPADGSGDDTSSFKGLKSDSAESK